MKVVEIHPISQLCEVLEVPGDKSISHRALIFGALSEGVTEIENLLMGEDVLSTKSCLEKMGVKIVLEKNRMMVTGAGLTGFSEPSVNLDCGNSGTTMRTMMGLISGMGFKKVILTGDASLSKRPMRRVAEPLRLMGARIDLEEDKWAPVILSHSKLNGIDYDLKVASAQVKTAILLAGLFAEGKTVVRGQILSRDHTERMLPQFGVKVDVARDSISIEGGQKLKASVVRVPGDPSSAAYWASAAAIFPGSRVEIQNVSLNPTRLGFFRILSKMGAKITQKITLVQAEPIGNITIEGPDLLRGCDVPLEEVASLIDEIPMLSVVATLAHGKTRVTGAEELRVKESDRIESLAVNLRKMGAKLETHPDGFVIEGPQKLHGADVETFEDHRIAMAFSIAALKAVGTTSIHGADCVNISYPEFFNQLQRIQK